MCITSVCAFSDLAHMYCAEDFSLLCFHYFTHLYDCLIEVVLVVIMYLWAREYTVTDCSKEAEVDECRHWHLSVVVGDLHHASSTQQTCLNGWQVNYQTAAEEGG